MLLTETMGWDQARADAAPIRFAVFVDEQKVPSEIELDEHDPACLHVVARSEGRAVGTGRLLPDGHIGRMAVLKAWRGQGVGAAMLAVLIDAARARGDHEVALSAQTHALGFYRRFGFTNEGPEYIEAGIPHQAMRRVF
ncbi:MAG: GNAT family N-acetyltransferase [Betaproteobacteria bacterium]